jgi:predicted regulator of Ras-like GTPase activity (Roadblock/LC7/MglB family)
MRRRAAYAQRDQPPSKFAATLGRLCDALPAVAAAVVDAEGETVDYAGYLAPDDIKIMAAELQLVLAEARRSTLLGDDSLGEVVVRAQRCTFAIVALQQDYFLVLQLPRRAFTISHRALTEAVRELCREGQLEIPPRFARLDWLRVDVREDPKRARRPLAVWSRKGWAPLEILGRYHGDELRPREVAYRVRIANGMEVTVVRERLGKWYSDRQLPH